MRTSPPAPSTPSGVQPARAIDGRPVTPGQTRALARYRTIGDLLDDALRVPGTSFRFGLDPLLGLVPVFGDLLSGALSIYGIAVARNLGAPVSLQARMGVNIAFDAIVGLVPAAGDVFDFFFKAHVRNRQLLETWLMEEGERSLAKTNDGIGLENRELVPGREVLPLSPRREPAESNSS